MTLVALLALTAPAAQAQDTPATNAARYLDVAAMGQNPAEANRLARSFLAPVIAEAEATMGRAITVEAILVTFADGRQMLRAALCDSTYFGITGCQSNYFIADPGAAGFAPVLELIGAGRVWFDAQLGVAGWPDLILGRTRMANEAEYVRWRWNGQSYDIVGPL